MKYTQGTFTLPASGNRTTQEDWDRAFLSPNEFIAKYSKTFQCGTGEMGTLHWTKLSGEKTE